MIGLVWQFGQTMVQEHIIVVERVSTFGLLVLIVDYQQEEHNRHGGSGYFISEGSLPPLSVISALVSLYL